MKKIEATMPTNLRLPLSTLKKIKRIAKDKKTTQAEAIRYLLDHGFYYAKEIRKEI